MHFPRKDLSPTPDAGKRYAFLVIVGGIGVTSALVLFLSTLWGIGITPDSVAYLQSALDFRTHPSLTVFPITWPPLYPFLLSLFSLPFDNVVYSARFFHAVFFAINVTGMGLLVYVISGRKVLAAVFSSLFFAVSPWIFNLHQMAWSEPAFLSFLMGSLVSLYGYHRHATRTYLYLTAISLAMAVMTRYAGVAFVGTFAVFILVVPRCHLSWYSRTRDAIVLVLLALMPLLIWSLLQHSGKGVISGRPFVMHMIDGAVALSILRMMKEWIFWPQLTWMNWLLPLFPSIYLVKSVVISKKIAGKTAEWLLFLLFNVLVYSLFILISKSFFDANIPIDIRIFLPCYVLLLLMLASILGGMGPVASMLFIVCVLPLVYMNVMTTKAHIKDSMDHGLGYLSDISSQLPLVVFVRQNEGRQQFYSNAADFLFVNSGSKIQALPNRFSPASREVNPGFERDYQQIIRDIQGNKAVVVYVNGFEWREYAITAKELLNDPALRVVYEGPDGYIFGPAVDR